MGWWNVILRSANPRMQDSGYWTMRCFSILLLLSSFYCVTASCWRDTETSKDFYNSCPELTRCWSATNNSTLILNSSHSFHMTKRFHSNMGYCFAALRTKFSTYDEAFDQFFTGMKKSVSSFMCAKLYGDDINRNKSVSCPGELMYMNWMAFPWKIMDMLPVRKSSTEPMEYLLTRKRSISLTTPRLLHNSSLLNKSARNLEITRDAALQALLLPLGEQRDDVVPKDDFVSRVLKSPSVSEEETEASDIEEVMTCPGEMSYKNFGPDYFPSIVPFVSCQATNDWCPFPERCVSRVYIMMMKQRLLVPIHQPQQNATPVGTNEENNNTQCQMKEDWVFYPLLVPHACICGHTVEISLP